MSGPVGQGGLIALSASGESAACAEQRQQKKLRAGARGPQRDARARVRRPMTMSRKRQRISGRDQQALFAARERDHHGVVQAGRVRDGVGIRRVVVAVGRAGGSPRPSPRRARADEAGFAAFRQAREPAAAFAQRPFQQRIVAAADDRRRRLRAGASATSPAVTQRSSAAFGNSQRPVTLVQGTAPLATSS